MRFLCHVIVFVLPLSTAILDNVAIAEVPPMEPAKLEAYATHVLEGKLGRVYTSVEKSKEWETTHSVGEVQVSTVNKGEVPGKLAYVRFWHRKYIGQGEGPDGAYGHRDIPAVGSDIRVFARQADDGGLDVVLPNGLVAVEKGDKPTNAKKTSKSD